MIKLISNVLKQPKIIQRTNLNYISNNSRLFLIQNKSFSVQTFNNQECQCWNCKKPVVQSIQEFPQLCPNCSCVQKPKNTPNYFEIFNQTLEYRIDTSKINSRAKLLQRKLHPDLFTQKAKAEQVLSEELSSLVNKAYAVLNNPIERGLYLLAILEGEEIDLEKELTQDAGFLGQIMELNEQLEEISTKKDWENFRNENRKSFAHYQRLLEESFASSNRKEAKSCLAKMKYFDSINNRLKELQSRLGIVE